MGKILLSTRLVMRKSGGWICPDKSTSHAVRLTLGKNNESILKVCMKINNIRLCAILEILY